jgi:hypothetical protein
LPFFAKIFESLILKRILPYIFSNNTQFGFRASHATTDQLHRLVDAISFSLEKKNTAHACSLMSHKPLTGFGMKGYYLS